MYIYRRAFDILSYYAYYFSSTNLIVYKTVTRVLAVNGSRKKVNSYVYVFLFKFNVRPIK